MLPQSLPLIVLALLAAGLGVVGLAWCRCARRPAHTLCGPWLFLGALLVLGATCGLLAYQPGLGVVYFGLLAGGLLIGMMYDAPPRPASDPHMARETP